MPTDTIIKPASAPVQFSTPLAGIGIRADLATVVNEAMGPDRLIADQVFPPFGVEAKQGTYPVIRIKSGNLLKAEANKRAPGASYERGQRQWDVDTYGLTEYGREEVVDDSNKANVAKYFDDEALAMTQATRAVKLAQEIRAATLLMTNDDTFAAGFHKTAAKVAYTEANLGTINMPGDILGAIDTLALRGQVANAIVIPAQVWLRAKLSTLLQNYLRGAGIMAASTGVGVTLDLTERALAQAFGLEYCLIGHGVYDSAAEGKATSISRAWGNTYFWVGSIKGGDPRSGGAGRTLYWERDGGMLVSESYREEQRRSDIVRCRQTVSEKATNFMAGELVTTSYA